MLDFEIDEKLLAPFELVSADLEALNSEVQQLYLALLQYTPTESIQHEKATQERLFELYAMYIKLHDRVAKPCQISSVNMNDGLDTCNNLKETKLSKNDQLDLQQQIDLAERVGKELSDQERIVTRQKFDDEIKRKIDSYDDPVSYTES